MPESINSFDDKLWQKAILHMSSYSLQAQQLGSTQSLIWSSRPGARRRHGPRDCLGHDGTARSPRFRADTLGSRLSLRD